MKKVLLFLSILLFSVKANASHITGAEITYTSLGNNQYEVHMYIYWDCTTGFNPGSSQSLSVDGCLGSQFVTMNQSANTPGDGVDISQICNSATSTCNNGTVNGNNMIEYTAIVTLPGACTDWTFSWSTCCRGGDIINLSGGQSAGNYAFASLNNVAAPNNNSPVFTAQPLPYLCVNQPTCYNFGVVEPDGHTLQYSLVAAQDAAGSSLAYTAPYSGTEPLTGITINPNTGQINFTPTMQGAFIVVVQVDEYDENGVIVGTVIRDVQVVVQNCNNQTIGCLSGTLSSANVSGNGAVLNPSNPYEMQICEGIPFSFFVTFTDPNATDSLFINTNLTTNPALAGAVVTTSYPNPGQANTIGMNFSWTAPAGSSGLNTFLTVTVLDNACPIPGQQVITYYLNILPAANAGPDVTICQDQPTTLDGSGPGGPYNWYDLSGTMMPVGPQFSCNPCEDPTLTNLSVGQHTYVLQTSGGAGCVNRDTVTVTVVPTFAWVLTPGPTAAGCSGNPIQLGTTTNPVGVYTYSWQPTTGLSQSTIANPLVTFSEAGTETYSVTMTSALGCIKRDSIVVTVQQGPPPFQLQNDTCMTNPAPVQVDVEYPCLAGSGCGLSPGTACTGNAAVIQVGTENNTTYPNPSPFMGLWEDGRSQFLFRVNELQALSIEQGIINSLAFNFSSLGGQSYSNLTIKLKCTSTNSLALGAWETGTTTVYTSTGAYTPVVGWNTFNFNTPYSYDGISNLLVEVCFDNNDWTGDDEIIYSNTAFPASLTYDQDGVSGCTVPSSEDIYNSRPNMRFNFSSSVDPNNYTYLWQPAIGVSNTTIKNPTITPPAGNTTYTVTVTTLNGLCSRSDSVTFTIGGTGADVVTFDSVFCSTDPVGQFFISPTTPTGGTWSHHIAGGTTNGGGVVPGGTTADFHPELSALGTSYVIYTVGPANCAIQDSVQVEVFQKIPANFTTIGPFCEYDTPVTLSSIANSAGGTWTINGTAATTFNPAVLGPSTAPGYAVKYKTDLGVGCPDSVSKFVEVFPAPNVSFNADTVSGCLPNVTIGFISTLTYATNPASGGTYTWSFGDATTSNIDDPFHTYTVAGQLSVGLNYTDNRGCMDDTLASPYITISSPPNPSFVYEPSNPTALEPHVDFFNTTHNPDNDLVWDWDVAGLDSSQSFNISYDFPNYGAYFITLRAITPEGCEAEVTRPVTIDPDYSIYVPNSFTPNGDGKNDYFIPKTEGVQMDDYTFSIYDRWGTKIFQTNDITEPWKGSKNNGSSIVNESGTYIWKVIYKDAFMKGHTITGHVTVIR